MKTQPEALRLADILNEESESWWDDAAAAELRRLHAVNQELLALLKECIHFVEYDPRNVIGKKARAAIAKGETK
jgi:hypothetical protein